MSKHEKITKLLSKELTKKDAIAIAKSGWWKKLELKEAAKLQLYQPLLVMPFDKFHKGMEKLLGRPVWSHEFSSYSNLKAEVEGKCNSPNFPFEILEKYGNTSAKIIPVIVPSNDKRVDTLE